LAASGFFLSLYIHIISLLGIPSPFGATTWGLHVGIFLIWFPAVMVSMKMMQGVPRKDFWKVALVGCPPWMRYAVYAVFGYAIFNFVIFMSIVGPTGKHQLNDTPPPAVLRGFSGHWLAFYGAGFGLLYSAYKLGWDKLQRKCPNGHIVSYNAKFCEQCGQKMGNG
jgi:hypothetical protein